MNDNRTKQEKGNIIFKSQCITQIQNSQYRYEVRYFPDKAILSLKPTYSVFAQEKSCHVRADKFLSETFIKQN